MNRSLAAAVLLAACQPPAPKDAQAPATPPGPAAGSPEWKIQNATSAGPRSISAAATVMDWPATPDGKMTELRPGTNGWTCMPDVPSTPGNDPMCLDATFLQWANAWQSRGRVQIKQAGFGYMLQGGSDASNTDPFATKADSTSGWINTGPHVMLVTPNLASLAPLPVDPQNGGPWVMWQKTPYAHVMMPVQD